MVKSTEFGTITRIPNKKVRTVQHRHAYLDDDCSSYVPAVMMIYLYDDDLSLWLVIHGLWGTSGVHLEEKLGVRGARYDLT